MKVRLPLRPRNVEGFDCPFPVVSLRVRDKYGALAEMFFRIDTQADFTSIPIPKAQREGIYFSEAQEGVVSGLVGQTTAYRGRIRILIAGREHDWPCNFVKLPVSRESGQQAGEPLPALGRAGFLNEEEKGNRVHYQG